MTGLHHPRADRRPGLSPLWRVVALAFCLAPGCGLILDPEPPSPGPPPPVPPPPELAIFDGGCFAGYGAADGVVRFDPVTAGMATGSGRGLFTAPLQRWAAAETGRAGITLDFRITVSPTESYDVQATARSDGNLELAGLPGATPTLVLRPCIDTVGLYDTAPTSTRTVSLWNGHLDDPPDRAFVLDPVAGARVSPPRAIAGDWDGDGVDTPGIWDPDSRAFYLAAAGDPGPIARLDLDPARFPAGTFGRPLLPIAGDWNGDGTDTVGLFAEDTLDVFLIESASAAPTSFRLTSAGVSPGNILPVAGDWNGDGTDTVGLYTRRARSLEVWLLNRAGARDVLCVLGAGLPARLSPFAGDWEGDGSDGLGLYDPTGGAGATRGVRLYTVALGGCTLESTFPLGPPPAVDDGLSPLAGDWDGR